MAGNAAPHSFIHLQIYNLTETGLLLPLLLILNKRAGSGVGTELRNRSAYVYAVVTPSFLFAWEELQLSSNGRVRRSLQSHLMGKRDKRETFSITSPKPHHYASERLKRVTISTGLKWPFSGYKMVETSDLASKSPPCL